MNPPKTIHDAIVNGKNDWLNGASDQRGIHVIEHHIVQFMRHSFTAKIENQDTHTTRVLLDLYKTITGKKLLP
jgi:hypothetical protein